MKIAVVAILVMAQMTAAASVEVPASTPTTMVPVLVDGVAGAASVEVSVGNVFRTLQVGNESALAFSVGPVEPGHRSWLARVYGNGSVQEFNGSVLVVDSTGPLLVELRALAEEVAALRAEMASLEVEVNMSSTEASLAALAAKVEADVLEAVVAAGNASDAARLAADAVQDVATATEVDALRSVIASGLSASEFESWIAAHGAEHEERHAETQEAQSSMEGSLASYAAAGKGFLVVAGIVFAGFGVFLWQLNRRDQNVASTHRALLAIAKELGVDPDPTEPARPSFMARLHRTEPVDEDSEA